MLIIVSAMSVGGWVALWAVFAVKAAAAPAERPERPGHAEPPAVVSLPAGRLESLGYPATLLDLAARGLFRLEGQAGGPVMCVLGGNRAGIELTSYERQAFAHVVDRAGSRVDVPATALSDGFAGAAASGGAMKSAKDPFMEAFRNDVIEDSRQRGLTRRRLSESAGCLALVLKPLGREETHNVIVSALADVELRELRIFLALADELHFGRTAERLGISQPSVSEAIRQLERRVGARLFERTSRRVRLTPVGAGLRQKLTPLLETLDRTLAETHAAVNGVSGLLRIATTETTLLPPVVRLASVFEATHSTCKTQFVETTFTSPYSSLRRGQADVLVNWLAVDEPDLTVGPAITCYERVLAVCRGHRLASRESISTEELADEVVDSSDPPVPDSLMDAIIPPRTPSGRIIKRTVNRGVFSEHVAGIALGRHVHPTMRGINQFERDDIILVPIHDLPALALGIIWRTAAEDARIRAFAEVARCAGPWSATGG